MPCKGKVSISPGPVVLLKLSLPGLQSHMLSVLIFLIQDVQDGEPRKGLRIRTLVGCLPEGMRFNYIVTLPFLPVSLRFFFYVQL